MIHTPVGARCRECANLRRVPLYDVSGNYYLRALGTGLGVAVAGGLLWAGLNLAIGGFFTLLIALGIGYATGEMISQAVNRKRGAGLQLIAGLSVFSAFVVSSFFSILLRNLPIASLDADFILAVAQAAIAGTLRSISSLYGLVALGIAVYLAVIRLR
jgi:hypothetical protein